MLSFRPSTAVDVEALNLDLAWRIRGVTALRDGQPVAIGGLAYLPDGTAIAFMEGADAIPAAPLSFHRAVARGLAEAKARGVRRIVAKADPAIEAAPRWLERLGFSPAPARDDTLHVWEA